MTQDRFFDYQDADSSANFNNWLRGMVRQGVYSGFQVVVGSEGGMRVGIRHSPDPDIVADYSASDGVTSIPGTRTLTSATGGLNNYAVAGDILRINDTSTDGDNGDYTIMDIDVGGNVITVERDWPVGSLTALDFSIYSPLGKLRTPDGTVVSEDKCIDHVLDPTFDLNLDTGDPTNPRIDIIYGRYIYNAGTPNNVLTYGVMKGTPAASPTPPTLTDNDIELAQVWIPASAGALNQADIYSVAKQEMFNNQPSDIVERRNYLMRPGVYQGFRLTQGSTIQHIAIDPGTILTPQFYKIREPITQYDKLTVALASAGKYYYCWVICLHRWADQDPIEDPLYAVVPGVEADLTDRAELPSDGDIVTYTEAIADKYDSMNYVTKIGYLKITETTVERFNEEIVTLPDTIRVSDGDVSYANRPSYYSGWEGLLQAIDDFYEIYKIAFFDDYDDLVYNQHQGGSGTILLDGKFDIPEMIYLPSFLKLCGEGAPSRLGTSRTDIAYLLMLGGKTFTYIPTNPVFISTDLGTTGVPSGYRKFDIEINPGYRTAQGNFTEMKFLPGDIVEIWSDSFGPANMNTGWFHLLVNDWKIQVIMQDPGASYPDPTVETDCSMAIRKRLNGVENCFIEKGIYSVCNYRGIIRDVQSSHFFGNCNGEMVIDNLNLANSVSGSSFDVSDIAINQYFYSINGKSKYGGTLNKYDNIKIEGSVSECTLGSSENFCSYNHISLNGGGSDLLLKGSNLDIGSIYIEEGIAQDIKVSCNTTTINRMYTDPGQKIIFDADADDNTVLDATTGVLEMLAGSEHNVIVNSGAVIDSGIANNVFMKTEFRNLNQDRSTQLVGGGDLLWILSTTTFSWSEPLYLDIPFIEGPLKIDAGSDTSMTGDYDYLYVDMARDAAVEETLTLQTGSKSDPLAVGDDRIIIARRYNNHIVMMDGTVCDDGETVQLGKSTISVGVIGYDNLADSALNFQIDGFGDFSPEPTSNAPLTDNSDTNPRGIYIADGRTVFGVEKVMFSPDIIRAPEDVNDKERVAWKLKNEDKRIRFYGNWQAGASDRNVLKFQQGSGDYFEVTDLMTGFAILTEGIDAGASDIINLYVDGSPTPTTTLTIPDTDECQQMTMIKCDTTLSHNLHNIRVAAKTTDSGDIFINGIVLINDNASGNLFDIPGNVFCRRKKITQPSLSTTSFPTTGIKGGRVVRYIRESDFTRVWATQDIPAVTTQLDGDFIAPVSSLTVDNAAGFSEGDFILVNGVTNQGKHRITSIVSNTLNISPATSQDYDDNDPVINYGQCWPRASIDRSNEELRQSIAWRQLGLDSVTTSPASHVGVMKDGVTGLYGTGLSAITVNNIETLNVGTSGSFTMTFIGTGLTITRATKNDLEDYTLTVDGILCGEMTGEDTSVIEICADLPYGTHTVQIERDVAGNEINIVNFLVYQPKTPTIAGSSLIETNIPATISLPLTQGRLESGVGLIRMYPDSLNAEYQSWTIDTGVSTYMGGRELDSGVSGTSLIFLYYGTKICVRGSKGAGTVFSINDSGDFNFEEVVGPTVLGLHKVIINAGGAATHVEAIDIVTPAHDTVIFSNTLYQIIGEQSVQNRLVAGPIDESKTGNDITNINSRLSEAESDIVNIENNLIPTVDAKVRVVQTKLVSLNVDRTFESALGLADVLLSTTITTEANSIVVHASFSTSTDDNVTYTNYFIHVDGSVQGKARNTFKDANTTQTGSIICKKAVTATTHTIELYWQSGSGIEMECRPLTQFEHATLYIQEVTD